MKRSAWVERRINSMNVLLFLLACALGTEGVQRLCADSLDGASFIPGFLGLQSPKREPHEPRRTSRFLFELGKGWGGKVSKEGDKPNDEDSFPDVIGKLAIDANGCYSEGSAAPARRFTSPEALDFVHILRREVDTVLTGVNSVIKDNPQLTVRRVDPIGKDAQPLRVVVDSNMGISIEAKVLDDKFATLVLYVGNARNYNRAVGLTEKLAERADERLGIDSMGDETPRLIVRAEHSKGFASSVPITAMSMNKIFLPIVPEEGITSEHRRVSLPDALRLLQRKFGVRRILVESGATLLSRFLELGLLDALVLVRCKTFEFRRKDCIKAGMISQNGLVRDEFHMLRTEESDREKETLILFTKHQQQPKKAERVRDVFRRAVKGVASL
eukprot:GHVN01019922.1.p1 GENE.GHVN01019922.1~~GHVN01019922.1.p1  ORF type:complete len:386 (+),score=51.61 GHVN01019922.1:432-1589(+)